MNATIEKTASSYVEEAAEVTRLKGECDCMIQESLARIDALLAKIDDILSREDADSIV